MGAYGGIEAFVMTLADWLRRNTTHEVRVCLKLVAGRTVERALDASLASSGLDYSIVRRGSLGLLSSIRWADVVHGNNCSPDIVLLAKMSRKPVVVTVHNWFRGCTGLRNRVWYLCNRVADWRTYNSAFVLGTWEPRGASGASELMPTVSRLPTNQAPFAARKGFLFIARLIANKGLDDLLAAYASATFDKTAWPLHVVGDGPLLAWAKEYIAAHGVQGVELLGFVPDSEKAHRIAHACWLVAPPNTREDMGLTPIEARNVAVPAIVTRDGGLPEAAGPSALLCEPGDVPGLRAALERAAAMPSSEYASRAHAAKASLDGYLRPLSEYTAIYERLVARRA
jgi:glycosyltransferase involved in cell wall biosynthesis